MTRRTAPAKSESSSLRTATARAVAWVELLDGLYRTEGEEGPLVGWLSELAGALEAERCVLRFGGDRERTIPADAGPGPGGEAVVVGREPSLTLEVVRDGRLGRAELELMEALAPHLERVCAPRSAAPTFDQALLPAALDRLSLGVLVVGSGGELLHANRAANRVLDAANGLSREGKGIRLASASAESALVQLRSMAAGDQRSRPASRLVIPRDSGAPLEVLAVSLEGLGVDDRSAVALFVSDPEIGVGTPPSVLRELYGLSRREADVVEQILLGRPLDEAATALGIHLETVRMHLKQVFQKVGTRRQVDLVRLLLTGVSSLHWE
jgi:DNA-binding CsgD family transcriptional regulator